jgi:hypothetical protein
VTHPNNLPLYQCYKRVSAAQIARIQIKKTEKTPIVTLHFVDPELGNINIRNELYTKHGPQEGWYYVVYPDGYESFSPPEAFEKGYMRIEADEHQQDPKLHSALLALHQAQGRADELITELHDDDRLRGRMAKILTGVADALYGPPEDDSLHDWSQLPARVFELRQAGDAASEQLDQASLFLSAPPPEFTGELAKKFQRRGAEIYKLAVDLHMAGREAYPKPTPPTPTEHPYAEGQRVRVKGRPGIWTIQGVNRHEDQIQYDVLTKTAFSMRVNQDHVTPA